MCQELSWGKAESGGHINFLLYWQFAVKMMRKREFWPVIDGQAGVDLRFPIGDLRFQADNRKSAIENEDKWVISLFSTDKEN